MLNSLKRLIADEEGATLVEYGLIIALVAAVCVGVVTALSGQIQTAFTATTAALAGH
jgi:pilus assembly protein Flp/PilA